MSFGVMNMKEPEKEKGQLRGERLEKGASHSHLYIKLTPYFQSDRLWFFPTFFS
jgi:hypothetical protein